jgi:transposase-like protein
MVEKAKRRRFSKEDKRRIVMEAATCVGRGEVGSLLRREGIYASTLSQFRSLNSQGLLEPGGGRKPKVSKEPDYQSLLAEQTKLERVNRDLTRKLAHAEKIISIQKKVAALLGETLQDMTLDEIDD